MQIETRRAAVAQVRRETGVGPETPDDELDPRAIDRANPFYDFETVLSRLATPEQFPHVFASLATWDPASVDRDASQDDEITFGLGIVLDGIDAYVRRRTGQA
ncbi:hypothetical protein [Isoptericola variabilis]|uniref:hypothetical protein n=1 Tax=Isoptericola variabilis TaxID=139208 RepID=UPI00163ED293|nr:hypothetical protein [Isoptericola variabilis]